eukprot:c4166_g1_i1.p1 GENE.c4166_g1_i1~~c4166_g1_i1.p1  ORF type:complete len:328 (+),score=88.03 c4166_g1_i1:29-985(+)
MGKHGGGGTRLDAGMKGILFTTVGEFLRRGKMEVVDLFTEHINAVYPNLDASDNNDDEDGDSSNEEKRPVDISKALQAEVQSIKHHDREKRPLLRFLETGCKGLAFLRIDHKNIDPHKVLDHYLESVKRDKNTYTRHCVRAMPIHAVCYAQLTDIQHVAKPIIDNFFTRFSEPVTYGVVSKCRNNQKFDRMAGINVVVKCVDKKNPVNLKHSHVALFLQVIKGLCLFGIADKYCEYADFNIKALVRPPDAAKSAAHKDGDSDGDVGIDDGDVGADGDDDDDEFGDRCGDNVADIVGVSGGNQSHQLKMGDLFIHRAGP